MYPFQERDYEAVILLVAEDEGGEGQDWLLYL